MTQLAELTDDQLNRALERATERNHVPSITQIQAEIGNRQRGGQALNAPVVSFAHRAALQSAPTQEDALQFLRQQYDDARSGENGLEVKRGNTWYRVDPSPENAAGLLADLPGDIADFGRDIAATGGGVLGAVMGAPAGPVGVYGGGGVGATAAGQGFDALMRSQFAIPDSRTGGQFGGDLALEAGLNLALPPVLDRVSAPLLRGLYPKAGPQARETLDAFNRADIEPTRGMLFDPAERAAISREAKSPVADIYPQVSEDVGRAVTQQVDDVLPDLDPTTAGRLINDGVDNYLAKFRATADELYGAALQDVPEDLTIPLSSVKQVAGTGRYDSEALEEIFATPFMRSLNRFLDSGEAATVNDVRQLISELGQTLGAKDGHLVSNSSLGELKRVYGALKDDLANALPPDSRAALDQADTFYRGQMDLIQNHIEPITGIGKRDRPVEDIYRAFDLAVRKRKSTVEALAPVLDTDASGVRLRDALGATYLREGAEGAEGGAMDYSAERLSTALNKARGGDELFQGSAVEGLANDARLMSRGVKQASSGTNKSGTGGFVENTIGRRLGQATDAGMATAAFGLGGADVGLGYLGARGLQGLYNAVKPKPGSVEPWASIRGVSGKGMPTRLQSAVSYGATQQADDLGSADIAAEADARFQEDLGGLMEVINANTKGYSKLDLGSDPDLARWIFAAQGMGDDLKSRTAARRDLEKILESKGLRPGTASLIAGRVTFPERTRKPQYGVFEE
jgi:hypothetical protein